MQHIQDLGFKSLIFILIFLTLSLGIVTRCSNNKYCGELAIELEKESKIIYIDTTIFHLNYDSAKSYFRQFPYIIKLSSNNGIINTFVYIGKKEDIISFVDVYDLEGIYGPVEQQFINKPWIKFLNKEKLIIHGFEFYCINYLSNTTYWTQAQFKLNDNLYGHVIVINGGKNINEDTYLKNIEKLLKSICINNK